MHDQENGKARERGELGKRICRNGGGNPAACMGSRPIFTGIYSVEMPGSGKKKVLVNVPLS
jgi:hypothetical protein